MNSSVKRKERRPGRRQRDVLRGRERKTGRKQRVNHALSEHLGVFKFPTEAFSLQDSSGLRPSEKGLESQRQRQSLIDKCNP